MWFSGLLRRWFRPERAPVAIRTPAEGDIPIRDLLRTAILQREQVVAFRNGGPVTFCPHVLASGPNGLYVLVFMIAGEAQIQDEGFSSPKRWRWIALAELGTAMRQPGTWFSGPPDSRPLLRSVSILVEAA